MQSPKSLHRRVRVRYVLPPQPVITPSEYHNREGTIRKLSYDVLLNIFRHYLGDSPQFWPRLVHICRKWRRIVFASHRALHLRLFCTHGTPVPKALDCWPTLPVVVQYGIPPAPHPPILEDEENIVAALKQSDRISSISLTVTRTLLEKLSEVERPFSELEHLALWCRESVLLTLSHSFQWGARLRTLRLTRVAIPSLPRLLYHSTCLVDLQLHDSDFGYISPEVFAIALSGATHLRTLSLHFVPYAPYLTCAGLPPLPRERVILPALMGLKYRGTSTYLDSLAARIDAPRLCDIDITIISPPPPIGKPHLGRFINRIAMHKLHRRADIILSEHATTISLTQPESPTRLKVQVSCGTLFHPLSYIAQICNGLYPFLLGVEHLRICATRPTSGYDNSDWEDWRKLLRLFRSTKWAHLAVDHSTNAILALRYSERQREILLPTLYKICMPDPRDKPLENAVKSFIQSRRFHSGHIIALEYERLRVNEFHETGPSCQRVTIETLSSDVLLDIFCHYLHASPRIWPTLTHVCRNWRQIVLNYPLGLDLRLYCTYGMPVSKILECWPPFPLVVNYGGFPELDSPAVEDDDNIITSLKESGRVSSICLTITSSVIEKLPAITKPFSELEELILLSQNNVQLTLPSGFRWGSRLRTLHSTRVAFPSFPQLLSPCQDLVDIQLHEIPSAGYFSPEALANALSGVTHLRTLSLHFLSFPSRRTYLSLPPASDERTVLPALTRLKYRGTSKYLDSFVARIDAPRLGDIDITFFSQPTMDASQLGRFIERIEMQMRLSQATIQISVKAISVIFHNPSTASPLRLQIPCEQLDWQLSSMAQICNHLSSLLLHVEYLHISSTKSPNREDGMASEQWLELIRAFGGAKDFILTSVHSADVLYALHAANGGHTAETLLPTLRNIRVEGPAMTVNIPLWDAAESFLALRQLSGRPVELLARVSCHICYSRFTLQKELKRHLVRAHAYRLYCGDFECKPGDDDLYPYPRMLHTNKHRNMMTSNLAPSYSDSHGKSKPVLDIFGPFTRLQAPFGLFGISS